VLTSISEEGTAAVFRVEDYAKEATSEKPVELFGNGDGDISTRLHDVISQNIKKIKLRGL
jgi:hypothetical protein